MRRRIGIATGVLALTGMAATAAPGAGEKPPRILNAKFTAPVVAGVPAVLLVKMQDPTAAVNGVRVRFGDDAGNFAESACRPAVRPPKSPEGPFKPGTPVTLTVPYTYLAAGTVTVRV